MLRNLGVRSKLLVMLAVPLAFLLALSGVVILTSVSEAGKIDRVRAAAGAVTELQTFVHELQDERAASRAFIAARGPETEQALAQARAAVDKGIERVRGSFEGLDLESISPALRDAAADSLRGHGEFAAIRDRTDTTSLYDGGVGLFYDETSFRDLSLAPLLAQASGDNEIANIMRSYGDVSRVIDEATRERDLLAEVFATDTITRQQFTAVTSMQSAQDASVTALQAGASAAQNDRLQDALSGTNGSAFRSSRLVAADMLQFGTPAGSRTSGWGEISQERIDALTTFESTLVADMSVVLDKRVDSANRTAGLASGLAILAFGLAVFTGLVMARRMVQPLNELTRAATDTAAELPDMVKRMQTPGEGPDIEGRSIRVESNDEFGRLAAAFNAVHEVTIKVAQEQAALRKSIADMFVNVARRNQVLLGRQLSFIDQLESREEDPDNLENLFRLDHLATRMRRNADSLLVLAGIDSTRRLRQALPLSDVVRTAISEIESYDRVDLQVNADYRVTGRLALSIAHLFAELLENATHFSNPDTRVLVVTNLGVHGVEISITDHGLGMSEDEIAAANSVIANPPISEIAVAQRLGFYVVGRIAQRIEATVVLSRGRGKGTSVVVTLPVTVFDDEVRLLPAPVAVASLPGAAEEDSGDVVSSEGKGFLPRRRDSGAAPEPVAAAPAEAPAAPAPAPAPAPAAPAPVRAAAPVEEESDAPFVPPFAPSGPSGLPSRSHGAGTPAPAPVAAAPAAPTKPTQPAKPEPSLAKAATPSASAPAPQAPSHSAATVDILPDRGRGGMRRRRAAAVSESSARHAASGTPAEVPAPRSARAPMAASPFTEAAAPVAAAPAAQPVMDVPPAPSMEAMAASSKLQSEALSELSRLYSPPAFTPEPAAAGGLTRRTRKTETVPVQTAPAVEPGDDRPRTATEVRGMLAGFRAGVERGRTSPVAPPPGMPAQHVAERHGDADVAE